MNENEKLSLEIKIQKKLMFVKTLHEIYGYYTNTYHDYDDCEDFMANAYDICTVLEGKSWIENKLEKLREEQSKSHNPTLEYNIFIEEIVNNIGDGTKYVMKILNKEVLK